LVGAALFFVSAERDRLGGGLSSFSSDVDFLVRGGLFLLPAPFFVSAGVDFIAAGGGLVSVFAALDFLVGAALFFVSADLDRLVGGGLVSTSADLDRIAGGEGLASVFLDLDFLVGGGLFLLLRFVFASTDLDLLVRGGSSSTSGDIDRPERGLFSVSAGLGKKSVIDVDRLDTRGLFLVSADLDLAGESCFPVSEDLDCLLGGGLTLALRLETLSPAPSFLFKILFEPFCLTADPLTSFSS